MVGYLDEMLKDGREVFVGAVVEGVDGFGALERERLGVCSDFLLVATTERTGNFHLVSHSALMPSWCGMRRSKASAPMIQFRGGCSMLLSPAPAGVPSVAWGDMVQEEGLRRN